MAESYEEMKRRLERDRNSAERQDHAAHVARRRERFVLACLPGLLPLASFHEIRNAEGRDQLANTATKLAEAMMASLDQAEREDRIRAAVPEDAASEEFIRKESERFRAMDHNKLALLHACTVHDYERLLKAESK